MFQKNYRIRWNDLDANMHLANSAYIQFMSDTRLVFFNRYGFSLETIAKHNLAPVVFYEHIYYFKEVQIGQSLTVHLDVTGLSADGMFFSFDHNFYNDSGYHVAHCEMLGAWMDYNTRKLTGLNDILLPLLESYPKGENFKVLTKADTRKFGKKPSHLTV